MKIQSSNVNMYSNSYDSEKTSLKRTLIKQNQEDMGIPKKQLSSMMKDQLKQLQQESLKASDIQTNDEMEWTLSDKDYQKMRLLERILSKLTGKEVKFIYPEKIRVNEGAYNGQVHSIVNKKGEGASVIYQEDFIFHKKSSMEIKASGQVTTEDGRTINFNMNLKESREVYIERSRRVGEDGKLVDPLVLSFDGKLPQLTDEKYSFDLDHDGTQDQISFLTKGSGFLALDKNSDGKINDGSELFGTQSGSGFRDLAVFDQDKNGWIDENDAIFDKLRIWIKDDSGNDQLLALGEKGIGAIFLGSVPSKFDVLGSNFEKNGVIQESGFYLKESGIAYNMHHVDIKL